MKNFIKIIIFLICINLSLPCFAETPQFKAFYAQGLQAYKVKNYAKAISDFNTALKYNPSSYRTYCLLGVSYGSKGDLANAENVLQKAIKLYPDNWNAYTFLADVKKAKKNYPIAIEYYSKAISLSSMPANSKVYYKALIEKTKQEQNKNNAAISNLNLIKNTVELNLDWQKWQKAYEVGKENNWIIEYGLKGQDVRAYKWTQLVTVQYYKAEETTSIEDYFKAHLATLEKMAQNTNKSFVKTIISQDSNEIVYFWSYGNGAESEVARIVKIDKSLYHLHFAKKGIISADERNKWLNIFKSAKITE